MTLAIDEFIRRFLIHVLPGGFHRIRHYGLFANNDARLRIDGLWGTRPRNLNLAPRRRGQTAHALRQLH